MRASLVVDPDDIELALDLASAVCPHCGGVYFFQEFLRVLQICDFLVQQLTY
jgi:uncharacterized protein (DUF983 family)